MFINESIGRYGPPVHVNNIGLDSKIKGGAVRKLIVSFLIYGFVAMWIGTEVVAGMLGFSKAFKPDIITTWVYNPWAMFWPWAKLWNAHHVSHATLGHIHTALIVGYGIFIVGLILSFVLGRVNAHAHIRTAPRTTDWQGGAHWARPEEIGQSSLLPPDHWATIQGHKLNIKNAKKSKKKPPAGPDTPKLAKELREKWNQTPYVFVGEWYDEKTKKRMWMRDASDRHLALFAPTRGGKGVGIIIPTCLTWSKSLVVNDPKGELYDNTAGYRKHGFYEPVFEQVIDQKTGQYVKRQATDPKTGKPIVKLVPQRIFKFDPLCNDGSSARINVLDFVRIRTDFEVADAQNVAKMICDPQGIGLDTGSDSDHWRKTAYSFLTGVILHLLYKYDTEPEGQKVTRPNMAGVDDFLSSPDHKDEMAIYEEMKSYEHDPHLTRGWIFQNKPSKTCTEAAKAGQDMKSRPDGERGSVLSSVKSYLDLYRDPTIARNTATSDFSFEDMMYAETPATLYLINNPDNMERIRPLMRLIVNVLMTTFTGAVEFDEKGQQRPKYKNKMLILMDEFTSTLGKMSIFANAMAFVAGYGIKVMIIVQDLVQLSGTYGDDDAQSLTSNIHTRIMYATNNNSTASSLSEMLGSETVRQETISHNGGKASKSESFIGRPLLTPADLGRLPDTDEVIMVTGNPPIYAKKIKYFEEPFFQARGKMFFKPPAKSDSIPRLEQAYQQQLPELYKAAKEAAAIRIADSQDTTKGIPPKTAEEKAQKNAAELTAILGINGGVNDSDTPTPLSDNKKPNLPSPDYLAYQQDQDGDNLW